MTSRSWGRGCHGFCDDSTKALVAMGEGGVKNCPKMSDVIYGRTTSLSKDFSVDEFWSVLSLGKS